MLRVGQGPVEPHKLNRPGATPGPAISLSLRVHAGKIRSVGAAAARCFGKAAARVRLPDGPLTLNEQWAAGPTGRHLACNQEIGVRLPGGPLNSDALMVQRQDIRLAV